MKLLKNLSVIHIFIFKIFSYISIPSGNRTKRAKERHQMIYESRFYMEDVWKITPFSFRFVLNYQFPKLTNKKPMFIVAP